MEQASSVMKAIEKAWISADSPKEFSVKVFEKEEKNFFGMTTKSAKIGIFFTDKHHPHQEKSTQKNRIETKEPQQEEKSKILAKQNNPVKPNTTTKSSVEIKKQVVEKPKITFVEPKIVNLDKAAAKVSSDKQPQRAKTEWNDLIVNTTRQWIEKTLSLMNMHTVKFTFDISGKNLKLIFDKPLLEDPVTEKQLFRSLAHLIMSSLRNQYKQEIKDLKIILIRPE